MTYAELYLPTLSSPIFFSSCWCTTLYTKHARLTFCLIHNIYTDMYLSSYYISIQHILLFLDTICECVRSNSNFHPQNQDVDFDMLEMFFSFQCAKYEKNRWLNTKLFKKRDVIALKRQYVYSALLWHTVYCCVIQWLVTSDESYGTQNGPGHPVNEWGWLSRRLGVP